MSRTNAALFILALVSAACQSPSASMLMVSTETAMPSPESSASPSSTPRPASPTETIAPAPRSFTEGFDGNLAYWAFLQIDNGQPSTNPTTQDGFLVFDLSFPNQWVYALYGRPDYADVRVDAQAEVRAGADGAVGVVCRYGEKTGWYEFNIYADQTYEILYGQWLTQGVARITPIVRSQSEKIKADANEISLLCQGNTLTPFINGVQMRARQETKYALESGKIGISASSFEVAPYTIAYDWVKVSEP